MTLWPKTFSYPKRLNIVTKEEIWVKGALKQGSVVIDILLAWMIIAIDQAAYCSELMKMEESV